MTVETNAQFISALNKTYPTNRDLIKEGDDHIRLVKSVLQNTFPGMDKAVTADSDKLNKLDATLTYSEDTLQINNNIQLKEGKTADFGGAVLTKVGDPEDPEDAVNLRSLQGSLMWPIGSIFMTVDSRDPSVILGFGTWEKFAAGRVLVGTGTTTDINNDTRTVVNEARGGAYTVKLTETQLPAHTHTGTGTAAEAGSHGHILPGGGGSDGPHRQVLAIDETLDLNNHDWRGNKIDGQPATNEGGAHSHAVSVTVESTGKGEAFDIAPPYIACNIWKRIADPTP